jgi:hypothetical protein
MGVVAEIHEVGVVPMGVIVAVEIVGLEAASVSGGILVSESVVVGPNVVPGLSHWID